MTKSYEETLQHVNTGSRPSDLRITDIKVCDMEPPFSTTLIKIQTNQGIEGYGQVRENGSRLYALQLKRLLLGENPCNVDKLFRRMKQFGHHSHQGGGVSGMEVALWDLAGKAYGVPVWQMLGGKFRDKLRVYCDTDVKGKHDGVTMGKVLKERIEKKGYTWMKMDVSVEEILFGHPDAFTCPTGYDKDYADACANWRANCGRVLKDPSLTKEEQLEVYRKRNAILDVALIPGPFTGLHISEKGLDLMEEYVKQVRDVVGYSIPISTDHFGHIGVGDCIRLAQRLDKYNLAWYEDMVPWYMADHLAEIQHHSCTPLATGEDIYLKENFVPLLEKRSVNILHPDVLSAGGIYETKKIADMAQDYGIPVALHMNETPIGCMAAAQVAAASENFMVMEFHHNDYPWWASLVNTESESIIENGYITVPSAPGIGIESINDEVLREHLHVTNDKKNIWMSTDEWDDWYAADRLWL